MSDVALAVGRLGEELTVKLVLLNLWTALMLGAALAVDRAVRRRVRAAWCLALYAPIALRVALPLDWNVSLPGGTAVAALVLPVLRLRAEMAATGHARGWAIAAVVVYALGVVFLALRAVRARRRLSRALAGATAAPGSFADAACEVRCHENLGPMVVGLLAPAIVIPRRLLGNAQQETLSCVLRHESAHVRRRDGWLAAAMQLSTVAAWPVLPLWIAVARVRQLVELACDEAALAHSDASARRRYGHALLDVAEWRFGAGELHFGSTLRARIEALASPRRWPRAAQALVLFVAPLVVFAACSGATSSTVPTRSSEEGYGYEFETDPLRRPSQTRLPPEAIQAVVRAHFGEFQKCYEAGLEKDPGLRGKVNVRYVFGEDGVTHTAADEHSTLPDQDVVGCVVREFGKLTYPKGKGGDVSVVYPIEFAP
jgi:BlaR1 peptidase M56